jgi:trehalose 6-phosphate phosphatase
MNLPEPTPDWAVFLDFDGSIVEIAETPDAVVVEPALKTLLTDLKTSLGGALAIVSGRPIAVLDEMIGSSRFAAAGLHGLERRNASGQLQRAATPPMPLDAVRDALIGFVRAHAGLALEDKGVTLALHYRGAPQQADACRSAAANAVNGTPFEILPGKMVLEIKPPGTDKGDAIEAFLAEAPFKGRVPVFCGDDLTDESGFAAVNARGGHSIKVGIDGQSNARFRVETVIALRLWLEEIVRAAAVPA